MGHQQVLFMIHYTKPKTSRDAFNPIVLQIRNGSHQIALLLCRLKAEGIKGPSTARAARSPSSVPWVSATL